MSKNRTQYKLLAELERLGKEHRRIELVQMAHPDLFVELKPRRDGINQRARWILCRLGKEPWQDSYDIGKK